MKKEKVSLLFIAFFFVSVLFFSLRAHPMIDRIEQARTSGNLVKKNNLQDLLQHVVVKNVHDELSSLLDRLNGLVWAGQEMFVQTLDKQSQWSKPQALIWLKGQVADVSSDERYPFIAFMHALIEEYDFIQSSTTKLFLMINKKERGDGELIQQGLETIEKLKNNLEQLLTLVNDLLL